MHARKSGPSRDRLTANTTRYIWDWRHPERTACARSDVLLRRRPEDEPAKPLRLVEVELLSDRRPRSPVRVTRGVSALVKVGGPHLVGK